MKRQKALHVAAGFAIGAILSLPAGAQTTQTPQTPQTPAPGGSTTGPSTPGRTAPSIPTTPSPTPGTREPATPFPEIRRPIFLSGKVVMEDGTPPPDSVVVERVCNGVPRPEGYTDSKGRFSIQLGRDTHLVTDASVSADASGFGRTRIETFGGSQGSAARDPFGGMSERDLAGCELRASLPGYRSDVVMLSGRRMFDNPDVGTIVLRRLGAVDGTTISITSLKAPKDAKKAYENGRKEIGKKKWASAQKELEKAVQIYPEYASAWYELGRSLEQQDKVAEARDAYQKALAADARFVSPYLQLAGLAARENKWQEVADTTDRVAKLNPFDFPGAYYYNAIAQFNLRNLPAAEKSAQEALKLDTQHRFPKAGHLLGIILAQKGDFQGAAKHLKDYLALLGPDASEAGLVKKQLAEVERLMGAAQPAAPPNP